MTRCQECHERTNRRRTFADKKLCSGCYFDAKRDAAERESINVPILEVEPGGPPYDAATATGMYDHDDYL